jgi:hypothetical protein
MALQRIIEPYINIKRGGQMASYRSKKQVFVYTIINDEFNNQSDRARRKPR